MNHKLNLSVIILTFNEALHIERCINSVKNIAKNIVIVDSLSTDETVEIAKKLGVLILQKTWTNHAEQFNWALDQINDDPAWILRLDADEFLTTDLQEEIKYKLPLLGTDISGVYFNRRINFQGNLLKYGGLNKNHVLRLFRYQKGRIENRYMDEHIKVIGLSTYFKCELIDENLKTLTWWTNKHNNYSSKEAIELLNIEYSFLSNRDTLGSFGSDKVKFKRWCKENIYTRFPIFIRSLMYFLYRFIFLFGFLDGKKGFSFHFLQGFWYRYLVDIKILEVKSYMSANSVSIEYAIEKVLDIKLQK